MNKDISTLVNLYLEAQENAWSPATMDSEKFRLRHITQENFGNASELYAELKAGNMAPYSIKTTVSRARKFFDWLMDKGYVGGPNPYKEFMTENARLFKYAYQKERLEINYAEALSRIDQIEHEPSRKKALQLLASGMRYSESFTLKDGHVVGKGGKRRRVFLPPSLMGVEYPFSYQTFRRHLMSVGLKPHTLRKLAASKLREKTTKPEDLMEIFGWSSIQTAASYLQPVREKELAGFMEFEGA